MENNTGNDINLTLDGDSAPEIPVLTLPEDEIIDIDDLAANQQAISEEPLPPRNLEEDLSPEELKMVDEFSQKIDIANSAHILQYGATSQKKMVSFSETALNNVKNKDLGKIGESLTKLTVEIKDFDPDNDKKGGFFGLFKGTAKKVDRLKTQYSTVEANVNVITSQLEGHKRVLLKDITMLDKMYDMNLDYYKELTLYILAGKKKLADTRSTQLPALQAKAKETGQPQDAQAANDLANQCIQFEKKLHDLELTRNISIQMGPQVRLVQNNDSMMAEKIQSTIVNTIPLWKNQIVIALGLQHSQEAIKAQREVTDLTNQLLKDNADNLKTSTIETAKESERGIVDIETLKHTNQALISTIDEVMKIQQEGAEKRRLAEGELQKIENELKAKLLEVKDTTNSNMVEPIA